MSGHLQSTMMQMVNSNIRQRSVAGDDYTRWAAEALKKRGTSDFNTLSQ